MTGPIRSAYKFADFGSNNQLAEALLAANSRLNWGVAKRSLGNKIGELDKGITTWWRNKPDEVRCLAEMLELSLEDLGLHEKADRTAFSFQDFPELPPLDLKHEPIWPIATEVLDPQQVHPSGLDLQSTLDHWLDTQSTFGRRPPFEFDWLWIPDELHRHLIAQRLNAAGQYDVVFAETLGMISARLSNLKPVVVVIEQDGGSEDLAALAGRQAEAGILVIAPFMWKRRSDSSSNDWMSWEVRAADSRKAAKEFSLTSSGENFGGAIQCWEFKKVPDWRERLLMWVEGRLNRHSVDSLFSAKAVDQWLKNFDPLEQWFCTTSDLLQLCRLVHHQSEKKLPEAFSPMAGAQLSSLFFKNTPAETTCLIAQLTALRWQSSFPWEGPLSLTEWLDITGNMAKKVSRADLDRIVQAKTVSEREAAADCIADLLDMGNPNELIKSGLLQEVVSGAFDFQYPTFARLIARDLLIAQIANGQIDDWALNCFDPGRRPLVDAALDTVSIDLLVKVAQQLKENPDDSAQSVAADEALFIAIGKRIARRENIPDDLCFICKRVVQRIDMTNEWQVVKPWTRPVEIIEDRLAWLSACWAWSLMPEACIDNAAGWMFPGWAADLPEPPYWLDDLMPNKKFQDVSPAFNSLLLVIVEWAKDKDHYPESWPAVFALALLQKAAHKGCVAQSEWWKKLAGQRWAEKLLLDCCKCVGKAAALSLWHSFLTAERELVGDTRHLMFEFSGIRIWLLRNLNSAEVICDLSKDDLTYLSTRSYNLPPEIRADLLRAVMNSESIAWLSDWGSLFELFGVHAAVVLEEFLSDPSWGYTSAKYLWRWRPERALALLEGKNTESVEVRKLLYLGCPQPFFPQALALLAIDDEALDDKELQYWIKEHLPNARGHAVLAFKILHAQRGADK